MSCEVVGLICHRLLLKSPLQYRARDVDPVEQRPRRGYTHGHAAKAGLAEPAIKENTTGAPACQLTVDDASKDPSRRGARVGSRRGASVHEETAQE